MSRFVFIHDFYRDGYNDMLAEVQDLQAQGLWTKERRSYVTKHEMSSYKALKHNFPHRDASDFAGRIAALRSAATAYYPAPRKEAESPMVFLPLPDEVLAFCGSCGDRAMWRYTKEDKAPLIWYRCDPCKQELIRQHSAYIMPDGWDWDSDEDQLDPVGNKLIVKEELQPESFFFPCSATVGFAMLDLLFHVPTPMLLPPILLLQVVFVLHLTVKGKDYWQAFCKWIESEL